MVISCIIALYLIIAYLTYNKVIVNWNHPKWEKIMLSLSWICIIPLYGIRKLQELFS